MVRGRNLSAASGVFDLDAGTIVRSRIRGERLRAIYHGHCDAPAVLSATDRRRLRIDDRPSWPGVDLLVVAVWAGRAGEVRAWRWCESAKDFVERE